MLIEAQMLVLDALEEAYIQAANPEKAVPMANYMKNRFEFLGLTKPIRKQIEQPFIKELKALKTDPADLLYFCWQKNEREWQYFGMEYANKLAKNQGSSWPEVVAYTISNKSWWDTVDLLATHGLGDYLLKNPSAITGVITAWRKTDNMWLNRACILFQLHYKQQTDTQLLASLCQQFAPSKEFFLQKAIGWALRHYSRTDAQWVKDFVTANPLPALSKREALRLLP